MIKDKQIIVGIDGEETDDPVFFAYSIKSNRDIYLIK